MSKPADSSDPWTYFGLFSNDQFAAVSQMLTSKGIEYYEVKTLETEERLKAWAAWDASSRESKEGHELFVYDEQLEKLGTSIVEMFPERKL
jgi:hypothetical protein